MRDNKYKIAIVFEADLNNRKGMTNAIINRISHLCAILPPDVEVYPICVCEKNNWLASRLRNKEKQRSVQSITIESKTYQLLWKSFSMVDYVLEYKFKRPPFFVTNFNRRIAKRLKEFDLVSAHSFAAGLIAYEAHKKYAVPYVMTWHGSDIHSQPNFSAYFRQATIELISNAEQNFFVSQALYGTAQKFYPSLRGMVLYNGVSMNFYRFSDAERNSLRTTYGIETGDKVVAFVGNLIPVKNVVSLPRIFQQIEESVNEKIHFWFIGDGELKESVNQEFLLLNIQSEVTFWGNQSYDEMPKLMNCIDLLVLPSKNEGLPLVTVEAIRCGVKVIGSNAGGIPEAIGKDNVVDLGADFSEKFSAKCVDALNGNYNYADIKHLTWDNIARKELNEYMKLLNSKRYEA